MACLFSWFYWSGVSLLTATALMSETCPVKDCLHMPSRMSHSLEVASQAPDTKVL